MVGSRILDDRMRLSHTALVSPLTGAKCSKRVKLRNSGAQRASPLWPRDQTLSVRPSGHSFG
jgi:hypothetical protein